MQPSASVRPGLIVASPCIPDRRGDAGRRRAWRLLEAAAACYAVTLAMQVDGPMHVHQWRRLASLCESVAVAPPGRSGMSEALRPVVGRAADAGAQAAVALSPSMWPVVADVPATRILDLGSARRGWLTVPGLGWIDPLRIALQMREQQAAAAACDVLVVESREDRKGLADIPAPMHLVATGDDAAWLEVLASASDTGRLARIAPTLAPARRAA